jgi:hypothetical protein
VSCRVFTNRCKTPDLRALDGIPALLPASKESTHEPPAHADDGPPNQTTPHTVLFPPSAVTKQLGRQAGWSRGNASAPKISLLALGPKPGGHLGMRSRSRSTRPTTRRLRRGSSIVSCPTTLCFEKCSKPLGRLRARPNGWRPVCLGMQGALTVVACRAKVPLVFSSICQR